MRMSHWKWTRLLSGNLNMEKSLASAVFAAAGSKPVIVILCNGGAVSIDELVEPLMHSAPKQLTIILVVLVISIHSEIEMEGPAYGDELTSQFDTIVRTFASAYSDLSMMTASTVKSPAGSESFSDSFHFTDSWSRMLAAGLSVAASGCVSAGAGGGGLDSPPRKAVTPSLSE